MIPDIGRLSLLIAFGAAVYAAIASVVGVQQGRTAIVASARNAIMAIFPLISIAAAAIIYALVIGDFSLDYVASVSSRGMPTYLKVTALWGGQAGSILFWNFLLAAFLFAAMLRKWKGEEHLIPLVIFVLAITQGFFLLITNFLENPFNRLAMIPADGQGLNPLLRHPGMIIHPPMLYLGFVSLTIPYAFALAALIKGDKDDGWIRITRRWTLVGWLFLSLGLILGGRWAYDVLGWGGYWAWDPVENASFMPWLAATAFLHSVMIQEKRSMFRLWNMGLIIATFCLMIYGTFIVRSGVITSVHSFAQSPIGPFFFGFLAIVFIGSILLILMRLDQFKAEHQISSFLSREAAFLLNNYLILGILVATFIGTTFPILSELVTGEKMNVGETYYEKVNGPLFAALLLLMGVAPMTMWFRTSAGRLQMSLRWPALVTTIIIAILYFALPLQGWGSPLGLWIVTFSTILTLLEFWKGTHARMRSKGETPWLAFSNLMARNRRRYGGYWIHLGVLVMGFGVIGTEFYQQQTQVRLASGESLSLGRYTLTFNGMREYAGADDLVNTEANLSLYENGRLVDTLTPRNQIYTRTRQPMTIPDLRATIGEDFYVLIVNWEGLSANAATFRAYLNPLVNWVWAGGIIFIIGTFIAAWPDPVDEKVKEAAKLPALQPAIGD
ncbi:MAG: heme lyase CcmF/NrfE family subunit [Chloroflexi bacterium]|nr:heme lyase CcmF/NrfE family subunit [Chloroflexota bacterium]MBP8058291.1 heme lyase CcmF/NrfE family subunit [Chloroflexota bacterium]